MATTSVGFEVMFGNKGVQFYRKYIVSQSCLCDDNRGGGGGSRKLL